jgi:kynurenine formamidase
MRRAIWVGFGCLPIVIGLSVIWATAESPDLPAALARAVQQGQVKMLDLTYALDGHTPYWPEGSPQSPFHAETVATYKRDGYFARTLRLPEHFGTHMDAPLHFDPQGKSVDQLHVQDLLLGTVVVDVSAAARANPDYRLTVQDLEKWETAHGPLPRGGAVLVRTGWGARWPSQSRYMDQDAKGVMHFPGFSVEAAHYLLDHARPKAIGIDTASIDYGPSEKFEVHQLTLHAGLYHLENLANLEKLPATGAVLIALPMKLRGGSGAPARVVALVPEQASGRN